MATYITSVYDMAETGVASCVVEITPEYATELLEHMELAASLVPKGIVGLVAHASCDWYEESVETITGEEDSMEGPFQLTPEQAEDLDTKYTLCRVYSTAQIDENVVYFAGTEKYSGSALESIALSKTFLEEIVRGPLTPEIA